MSRQGWELDPWGILSTTLRKLPAEPAWSNTPQNAEQFGLEDPGAAIPRLPPGNEPDKAGPSTRSAPRESGKAGKPPGGLGSTASLGSDAGIAANPGLASLPESTWNSGFSGQLLPLFGAVVYSRSSLELPRPSAEGVPENRRVPLGAAGTNPTLRIPLSPETWEYSHPVHSCLQSKSHIPEVMPGSRKNKHPNPLYLHFQVPAPTRSTECLPAPGRSRIFIPEFLQEPIGWDSSTQERFPYRNSRAIGPADEIIPRISSSH